MAKNDIETLAHAFADEMRAELGDRWLRFLAQQATDDPPFHTCSSHDFCDANMIMARAYERVYSEPVDVGDDLAVSRWNAAWNIAAGARFFGHKETP
jgi:hypothetical protein